MENQTPKTNKKKIIVHTAAAILIAVCSFFVGFATFQLTMDKEMRSLMRLKQEIQSKYYYEVDDTAFYKVLFDAVNREILDDYSQYLTAEEYAAMQQSATGAQEGVGITFLTENGKGEKQLLISSVIGNSPAEEAGLTAGEFIIGYGLTAENITPCVDFDVFKAFVDSVTSGAQFYVNVLGFSGQTRVVALTKRAYVESYVYYKTSTTAYGFTGQDASTLVERGEPLPALPDNAAYIRLTRFNGAAAEEFDTAMNKFRSDNKKHLVLDLRDNGGGYLDVMQKICKYFCKSAKGNDPVAAIADFGEYKEYYKAAGNVYAQYFDKDSRVTVIADKNSASASECLLGVMIDYGATAYGDICLVERNGEARTYGKGIMQTTYPLFGFTGEAVKLTTAQICWPKGNCIHGRGILPQDGTKTVQEDVENDNELTAAIQVLFSQN